MGPLVFTRKKYRWNDFAVSAPAPLIVDMKMTFHSGHFADTASASDDSATPVRNFTPSFSTSFWARRTAVAGSPAVSSQMNSTGPPRAPGPARIRLAAHPIRPASLHGAAGGAARDQDPRGCGRGPRGVVGGELAVPGRAQADRALLSRERRAGQGAARDVAAVRAALPPAFHRGHHVRAPGRAGPGRRRGQSGGEDVLAGAAGGGIPRGGPAPVGGGRGGLE